MQSVSYSFSNQINNVTQGDLTLEEDDSSSVISLGSISLGKVDSTQILEQFLSRIGFYEQSDEDPALMSQGSNPFDGMNSQEQEEIVRSLIYQVPAAFYSISSHIPEESLAQCLMTSYDSFVLSEYAPQTMGELRVFIAITQDEALDLSAFGPLLTEIDDCIATLRASPEYLLSSFVSPIVKMLNNLSPMEREQLLIYLAKFKPDAYLILNDQLALARPRNAGPDKKAFGLVLLALKELLRFDEIKRMKLNFCYSDTYSYYLFPVILSALDGCSFHTLKLALESLFLDELRQLDASRSLFFNPSSEGFDTLMGQVSLADGGELAHYEVNSMSRLLLDILFNNGMEKKAS